VTSVKYRPEGSPTNNTFLRNKFKGGSNEHEVPENFAKRQRVYMALPKSFYVAEKQETRAIRGQESRLRRFSPDYSKSLIAEALEEAYKAEQLEGERVLLESRID